MSPCGPDWGRAGQRREPNHVRLLSGRSVVRARARLVRCESRRILSRVSTPYRRDEDLHAEAELPEDPTRALPQAEARGEGARAVCQARTDNRQASPSPLTTDRP